MECHYHPEREGTDICAICGKSICKECGLEIAGKVYCKDCLEKIVGLGLDTTTQKNEQQVQAEPVPEKQDPVYEQQVQSEPVSEQQVQSEPVFREENIYQPQEEYEIPYAQEEPVEEYKIISDDSPYNIKDTIEYSGGLESSYISDNESIYQEASQVGQVEEYQPQANEYPPQVEEYQPQAEIPQQQVAPEPEYIYPDHTYEPQKTSARQNLEDKYEKYLDDLYFDENEIPLGEQLAKDEAEYGSLTRKEYKPRQPQQPPRQQTIPQNETPEQMEARIRAEIAREMSGEEPIMPQAEEMNEKGIHNLNYQEEKEPMGVVDILLTIILIIVILIVLYYLVYLFMLGSVYPTFMDAIFALQNPQNVINHILTGV